jgi:broad specificity phosphatase PhoE
LTYVYLVRHGQAGTRAAYDILSELGRRQSRLLGEHFLSQGLHFEAAYVGEMSRQQQTAEEIRAAYLAGRASFPTMQVDPTWDEFDLGRLFREIAPQLCAEDPEFRREYEEMLEHLRHSGDAHEAKIHRRWLPCDTKVVDAWMSGRYHYGGESWEQFRERVATCRLKLGNERRRENVLVVTSATPIAIWAGMSLEVSDARVMGLAGVLYNASYTVVRLREKQARLFTFNAAPHLAAFGTRTHR